MEEIQHPNNDEIIFVVDEERFPVNKKKLIKKSKFFSALYSGEYRDSASLEFPIKLDWSKTNIMVFIQWINRTNYDKDYYIDLESRLKDDIVFNIIELINIGIYFAVDELVIDLKDIIIKHHMTSQNALNLYLQFRKQPLLQGLQDFSYGLCLDLFERIPRQQLLDLSLKHFIELVGNINLQCSKEYLNNIMTEWLNKNGSNNGDIINTFTECRNIIMDYFSKTKTLQYPWQVAVIYRKTNDDDLGEFLLYIWDGICVIESVIDSPFGKKSLNGTRVLFRGFDMYVIGGQFGYKEFNTDIWKYSLLTKEWYYITKMPQELRHMTVVFWDTRLYLIGGTSRYRLKCNSQIYFDLDTKEWSVPEPVPGYFTDQSLACTVRDKIFVLRSLPYLFDPKLKTWESLNKRSREENQHLPMTEVKSVLSYNDMIIFLASNGSNESELWTLHYDEKKLKKVDSSIQMDSIVLSKNEIVGFRETSDCVYITTLYISDDDKIRSKYCFKHTPQNLHEPSSSHVYLGFFNTWDPTSIYNIIPDLIYFAGMF